jgi:hypothetical protein
MDHRVLRKSATLLSTCQLTNIRKFLESAKLMVFTDIAHQQRIVSLALTARRDETYTQLLEIGWNWV